MGTKKEFRANYWINAVKNLHASRLGKKPEVYAVDATSKTRKKKQMCRDGNDQR